MRDAAQTDAQTFPGGSVRFGILARNDAPRNCQPRLLISGKTGGDSEAFARFRVHAVLRVGCGALELNQA